MANGGSINLRLSLSGAEAVRAELDRIGPAGAKMGRELDRAMRAPAPGLRALDVGVTQARGGLENLAGRIGPVGTGMAGLGAGGLAVAAGVGAAVIAAGAAINQARGAMQFADDLEDAAAKINIGVEALQEWRFAAAEAGATAADADTAIDSFQKKLGEAMAGGRSAKWFERIGLDPKSFDSTEEALAAVIDKIAALGTEAERAAVAEKLGLGPLIPLIRQGSDAIDEMRAQARELGIVMDAEMIQRGAEANRQMEVLSQIIDMQLKQAFIDLGPSIVAAIGLVAQLATDLARALDQWKALDQRTSRGLQDERGRVVAERDQIVARFGTGSLDGRAVVGRPVEGQAYNRLPVSAMRNAPRLPSAEFDPTFGMGWGLNGDSTPRPRPQYMDAGSHFDALNRRIAEIDRETASRAATDRPAPTGGTSLIDVSRGGGGGGGVSQAERDAERRRKEAERALEGMDREELSVRRNWIRSVIGQADTADARAEVARQLLALDDAAAAEEHRQLTETIRKGDLLTEEQQARLDLLEGLRADVSAAEAARIEQELATEKAEARRAAEDAHAAIVSDILALASSEARTSEERRAIELSILELAQRRERAALQAAIEAEKSPERQAELNEQLVLLEKLYAAQANRVRRDTAGPVESWWNSQRNGGETSEWLQQEALTALDAVNGGLRDAWANATSAGDAMKRMGDVAVDALGRIADALLEVAIQRLLIQPLTDALFGGSGSGQGGGGLLGGFLSHFAGTFFGGGVGLAPKAGAGRVTVTGGKGFGRGGVVGATGLYPTGEYGVELADLPAGSRIYDTDRTERILSDFDRRMSAGRGAGGPPIVNMPVTIINKSSAEVTAQTRPASGGGVEVVLQDLMKSAIKKAGADGTLESALRKSPRGIRR